MQSYCIHDVISVQLSSVFNLTGMLPPLYVLCIAPQYGRFSALGIFGIRAAYPECFEIPITETMASLSGNINRMACILLRNRSVCGSPTSMVSSRLASSLTSVRDADGVRHVAMTSPKTRNALSLEMLRELQVGMLATLLVSCSLGL